RAAAGLERRRGPIAFLRARRPRNVILTVAVLAVIGLAIGAVAWIQSYQPLAFAGAETLPRGSKNTLTVNGYAASVGYHKGRPFQLGVEVQNTGRFMVRVLSVPYSSGHPWPGKVPWSARLVMATETAVPLPPGLIGRAGHGWRQRPLNPLHPFDLEPGPPRFVLLKGGYANCPLVISVCTIFLPE